MAAWFVTTSCHLARLFKLGGCTFYIWLDRCFRIACQLLGYSGWLQNYHTCILPSRSRNNDKLREKRNTVSIPFCFLPIYCGRSTSYPILMKGNFRVGTNALSEKNTDQKKRCFLIQKSQYLFFATSTMTRQRWPSHGIMITFWLVRRNFSASLFLKLSRRLSSYKNSFGS